jgi:dolichol-phosphate mannosyltransferase
MSKSSSKFVPGSVTIMVPAYNEEENLEGAVKKYDQIVRKVFRDYELLIFDDSSTDNTGKIADALARKNPHVRVVHNKKNMGLGYNYRTGFQLSKKEYYIQFSGEGDALASSVEKILRQAGKADIIMTFIGNPEIRPWYRRLISASFTLLLNLLFGLKVKYYNCYALHKTKILKQVKMTTNSFAYQAEVLVRLLKSKKKYSYISVPYRAKKTIGSSAFRIKNLIGVFIAVVRLVYDIYFKGEVLP